VEAILLALPTHHRPRMLKPKSPSFMAILRSSKTIKVPEGFNSFFPIFFPFDIYDS
jgi:hypothetical protein